MAMGLKNRASGGGTGGSITFILNATLRFLQLIFALAVVGLYAQDLHKAHKENKYSDGKWAYAVVIGSFSAVTALIYALLPLLHINVGITFAWDTLLFIFWCAVLGIFGHLYIHAHAQGDGGIKRMKNAVWIDLINLLLWLVSAIFGGIMFWRWMRGGRSLHTGRATV